MLVSLDTAQHEYRLLAHVHTDYWAMHCNSPLTAWAGMFRLDGATWEGYVRCSDWLLIVHPCQSLVPYLGSTSGAGLSRECMSVPCTTPAHRDSAHVPLPRHLVDFLHSKASTLKTPPPYRTQHKST